MSRRIVTDEQIEAIRQAPDWEASAAIARRLGLSKFVAEYYRTQRLRQPHPTWTEKDVQYVIQHLSHTNYKTDNVPY